ncbi:GNAT family N-acetyltransferase [Streptomyces sp. NEAU-W12]|uniref:GNAT family N-acetyltransferase n=1 Tax=Streptomyces sp. NEAU-W12 TaxID=2994668 RepID=UPI00224A4C70|nr:N-acetyltransferase [Streptomyces sp. NEAU-W12]MCX2923359.1 N-acetyltransferase [Streptomyces sp. NEAU-W12]
MSVIESRDGRAAGRLEAVAGEGGEAVGRIECVVLESPEHARVPVHTAVEPAHEGKGIAGSPAGELYAVAAREEVVVAPLCPYVPRWAARHPGRAPAVPPGPVQAATQWPAARSERF